MCAVVAWASAQIPLIPHIVYNTFYGKTLLAYEERTK
jgi:hypothetical protein